MITEYKEKNYCLHDCIINKIEIINSSLVLHINDGLYNQQKKLSETKTTQSCRIDIQIDNLIEQEAYEHISINVFKRNFRKNISFYKLAKMINDNNLRIYLDFYSDFANGLLIKGFCNKMEIELLITEINSIKYIFEEK